MITKNDIILLLTELQQKGIDTSSYLKKVILSSNIPADVLKFISENKSLDISDFYELLRHNYNKKKSSLYINIMKEIEDVSEVIITLSALLTQIYLYSKKLDDSKKMSFLKQARTSDVLSALNEYTSNYNSTKAIELIKLIKSDIKFVENILKN